MRIDTLAFGGSIVALIVGCVACEPGTLVSIGNPDVAVHELKLKADEGRALQRLDCLVNGGEDCLKLPNPLDCDELLVSIMGDGKTKGLCNKLGEAEEKVEGILEGIPFACSVDLELRCVRCQATTGEVVIDTCPADADLTDPSDPADPSPPGDDVNPGDPVEPPPPADPNDPCSPQGVVDGYTKAMNDLLAREGLSFTFDIGSAPDLPQSSFDFSDLMPQEHFSDVCASLNTFGTLGMTCDPLAEAQGRCFCSDAKTCRCARITMRALIYVCMTLENRCDTKALSGEIFEVFTKANRWINRNSDTPFQGWAQNGAGDDVAGPVDGPEDLVCLGSPLVLDTAGDGLAVSSLDEGVSFPLSLGVTRTAWPTGADDALLVLDRNGDGVINSGLELFGETGAADGFAALARLDDPAEGGNGNGLVEAGDLLFADLQLWTDSNKDGRSERRELRSLADAGVSALELRGESRVRVVDEHGNDLSLRARFHRHDGTTDALVDVYFVTSSN